MGLLGASTGAAASLETALARAVQVIVPRGGRPDLIQHDPSQIKQPTLLIVGNDPEVLKLNQAIYTKLRGDKQLQVIPYATHLFEESGTLEQVAYLVLCQAQPYILSLTEH